MLHFIDDEEKMKIAFLMHGITGKADKYGTGSGLDCSLAYDHFKKHILDVNDHVDVFYHTWSVENEDKLKELYKPKDCIAEEQIHFDFEYSVGPGHGGEGTYRGVENLRFHSLYSRWYSAQQANKLKKEYEEKNNFKYDIVMLTRFDLAYIVNFNFKDCNKEKLYVIGPDGGTTGYNDLWFFSSSENMDKFCNMYEFVKDIKHFPHKHTHNHYYCKVYVNELNLTEQVEFLGHRAWTGNPYDPNGPEGGPSPTVRHFYKLSERVTVKEDEEARKVVTNTNRKITREEA